MFVEHIAAGMSADVIQSQSPVPTRSQAQQGLFSLACLACFCRLASFTRWTSSVMNGKMNCWHSPALLPCGIVHQVCICMFKSHREGLFTDIAPSVCPEPVNSCLGDKFCNQ